MLPPSEEPTMKRITLLSLFLLLAVGGAVIVATPRRAGAQCGGTTTSTTTTTTTLPCAHLPATGQTTCWNSNGTVISCPGTGQDGNLRKGAALSYTDNGDGTITDNDTGLVWEKLSMDGSVHDVSNTYTWDNAFSVHVAMLNSTNFAGHTDWRLPNVKELESIVNYQNVAPFVSPAFNNNCTPGCTVLTCS